MTQASGLFPVSILVAPSVCFDAHDSVIYISSSLFPSIDSFFLSLELNGVEKWNKPNVQLSMSFTPIITPNQAID